MRAERFRDSRRDVRRFPMLQPSFRERRPAALGESGAKDVARRVRAGVGANAGARNDAALRAGML